MSLRKYSDYKDYMTYKNYVTKLKYDNLECFLSDKHFRVVEAQLDLLTATVNNDYLKKTENVYLSKTPNYKPIALDSMTSIILKPVDLQGSFFSIFTLPSNDAIQHGTMKNIINTQPLFPDKKVYIYSANSDGSGAFNNLGTLYNSYVFACAGDNLELCWNSNAKNWCVQKYGGFFINYTI
jgi:hypothetical protein